MGIRSDSGIWQYIASEIIGSAETVAQALNRLADTVHTQVLALKNRATSLEGRTTALETRLPNYVRFSVTRSGLPSGGANPRNLVVSPLQASPNAFAYSRQATNDPGTTTSVPNSQLTLPAGLYSVTMNGGIGEAATNRSFLQLLASIGVSPRAGITVGEDASGVSGTFAATAPFTLRPQVYRQSASASVDFNGEMTIVRLGAAA